MYMWSGLVETAKNSCYLAVSVTFTFVTGPPTHSVGGQTGDDLWRLSSSVTRTEL